MDMRAVFYPKMDVIAKHPATGASKKYYCMPILMDANKNSNCGFQIVNGAKY